MIVSWNAQRTLDAGSWRRESAHDGIEGIVVGHEQRGPAQIAEGVDAAAAKRPHRRAAACVLVKPRRGVDKDLTARTGGHTRDRSWNAERTLDAEARVELAHDGIEEIVVGHEQGV